MRLRTGPHILGSGLVNPAAARAVFWRWRRIRAARMPDQRRDLIAGHSRVGQQLPGQPADQRGLDPDQLPRPGIRMIEALPDHPVEMHNPVGSGRMITLTSQSRGYKISSRPLP